MAGNCLFRRRGCCSSGRPRVPRDELARRERLFCEGRWAQLLHECVAAAGAPAVTTADSARSRLMGLMMMSDDGSGPPRTACGHAFLARHRTLPTAATGQPPPSPTGQRLGHRAVQMSICGSCWTRSSAPSFSAAYVAGRLAAADVPGKIACALRIGRMVALTKPTGGVRALVMGDVFRRLVARTLAQQFGEQFRQACAPFQFALGTRAGAEALARALRAATEANPRTTVLSIDGVGAYDHISRASMLRALSSHAPLAGLFPFAHFFYGQPSRYIYYDERGQGHEVLQGEGGEQGDPLMPGLYTLGQHAALLHLHFRLRPDERLYACLDDIYVTSTPERTLPALRSAQEELSQHANVQDHLGKTRAWSAAGEEPPRTIGREVQRDIPPRQQGCQAAQDGFVVRRRVRLRCARRHRAQ